MRLRHKQPTLVSMWMLDVFCCALGCVILLLLLKMREASYIAEESAQASDELAKTRTVLLDTEGKNHGLIADVADRDKKLALLVKDRDELASNLALVQKKYDEASRDLALVQKDRDDNARNLALVKKELDASAKTLALVQKDRDDNAANLALVRTERDSLAKKLAVVENAVRSTEAELALTKKKIDDNAKLLALAKERSATSEEELAKKNADLAELAKKSADAQRSQDELQKLLREKEKLRADAMRQALDLTDRLVASESKFKNSEKQLDDLKTNSTDTTKLRTKVTDLEKLIADANVTIVDLQGTKAKLADKINKIEIDSEQRFAGIAMTGTNVLFLVDMSGSMDRTDELTPNPLKWPTVRETLVKVMRSIPDLNQYQVIVFSSKYSYLMGSDGQWLKYEKEKSIEQVRKAMAATKPAGDTNLYAAFEETFRFRAKGLDTVYLFSDGLPTSGPGLTPTEDRTLTSETERGVVLARHLRRTIRSVWNTPINNRSRVRINSIGFFYESPDVGAFLWALSREHDGSFVGMSKP